MNPTSMERLKSFLRSENLSAILLSNPSSLTWLSGYAPPIQTGQSPFEGGPALAWCCDGELTLLASDMESGAARAQGVEVVDYISYSIETPLAGYRNQAAGLARLVSKGTCVHGKIGVEMDNLPASLLSVLREKLTGADLVPVDGKLELLRAVKSAEELENIRGALKLCDLAQSVTKAQIQSGKTELDVWVAIKSQMEIEAGGRVPVLADLVGGMRTAEIGGLPGKNFLHEGDPVLADIVPRWNGYWGDNCSTYFIGDAKPELKKIHAVVLETLRLGIQAVKPGLKASELDNLLRSHIREMGYPVYPHHSGHGIGASYHEEPRIVPDNTLSLEAGMVIALEPGIYLHGVGGVRLEDAVLVTETGCTVLTKHLENA